MEATILVTNQDVVKDEPITLVSPRNPLPHETIFLSNIDQAVSFPVETLYFFRVNKGKTLLKSEMSEKVKKAVIETLIPYYFLAGRLRFNCGTERLELVCNNAGMVFVSAESRLTIEDLGDLSLPNPTFGHFIHRYRLYKSLAETPLFTIQVKFLLHFCRV